MCSMGKSSKSTAKAAAPAVAVATKSRSSSAKVKKTATETNASDVLFADTGSTGVTNNADSATVGGVEATAAGLSLKKKRKNTAGLGL